MDEGARVHTALVGAEPFYTQIAARRGFLGAADDAEWAAHIGDLRQSGSKADPRRVRPATNFRARFCPLFEPESEAWRQVD
jgi:hypothetical protein